MRASLLAFIVGCTGLVLSPAAVAHPPWGIGVDREGQVYFTDLETVWRMDARGRLVAIRPGISGRHTHDLHVDGQGNLYGEDLTYEPATRRFISALWRIPRGGQLSYLVAPSDDPPEGASVRRDRAGNTHHITKSPAGELLVLRRSADGRSSVAFGDPRAGRVFRQGVMEARTALGTDGSLYFVHGANVSRLSAAGSSTTGILTAIARDVRVEKNEVGHAAKGSPAQLFGIAVDARGTVYVADYSNRRVMRMSPGKRIDAPLRTEPPWLPVGVAVHRGDLYVLEQRYTASHAYAGTRVRRLAADGRINTLATLGASNGAGGD